jgi:hypothetical protein
LGALQGLENSKTTETTTATTTTSTTAATAGFLRPSQRLKSFRLSLGLSEEASTQTQRCRSIGSSAATELVVVLGAPKLFLGALVSQDNNVNNNNNQQQRQQQQPQQGLKGSKAFAGFR